MIHLAFTILGAIGLAFLILIALNLALRLLLFLILYPIALAYCFVDWLRSLFTSQK